MSSALLAGMCLGFLPHNYFPARIFMGDIGAALLGLLLAYGPISSTNSLDSALLSNYPQYHPYNRFGTILPLLVPAAIFLVPYTDLFLAVIRRTRRGKPVMAADREHLHHRLMGIGHSYRQSVLIMWLWAALFSVTVVSLSLVRSRLWVLEVATVGAILTLLPVTMPRLRPWRLFGGADRVTPGKAGRPAAPRGAASRAGAVNRVPSANAFAPASGASGNGVPGTGQADRVLRPFPGEADGEVQRRADAYPFTGPAPLPAAEPNGTGAEPPFPRAASRFPGNGTSQPSGDGPGNGQLPGDGPGNGQLPGDGPGDGRFADTDPFPASPGR